MRSFELIFRVHGHLDNDQQEILLSTFDEITVAIDPHQRCTITGQFEGDTAVLAARDAIDQLHDLGHQVDRMQEDLVDRGEIAARVEVTRQCIGNWINRERDEPFPAPAHTVPSEVWLWADVVCWLLATDRGYDTLGTTWPCQTDHDIINGELARVTRTDEYNNAKVRGRQEKVTWQECEKPNVLFSSPGLHYRWAANQETYTPRERVLQS